MARRRVTGADATHHHIQETPVLPNRPISHISYVVDDIERAVAHWSSTLGAGPFFLLERMEFDEVTHHGESCVFDHSAAFGQCGPIAVELQQIFATDPPALTAALVPGAAPVVNHVAYISPTPEADSDQLAAAGHELFLHATFGPVEVRFHDTRAVLGQSIEIHKQCEFIDTFFADVAAAARGWDGRDPLRTMG